MYLATKMPSKYFPVFHNYVDIFYDTQWPAPYIIILKDTAKDTLREAIKFRESFPKFTVVPAWLGYRKDLDHLKKEFGEVALPWWRPRNLYLEEGEGKHFIYLGYKNLDELYRNPPKILISGIALHAAVSGIDLKSRERRPSKLIKFSGTLTPEQIEAAQRNCRLLKGELKNG